MAYASANFRIIVLKRLIIMGSKAEHFYTDSEKDADMLATLLSISLNQTVVVQNHKCEYMMSYKKGVKLETAP